jgi:hypothetical protein
MCWNAEISLKTFFIGIIGIVIGLHYGMSLPVAFFCLSISLMQLIEYFVWSYYDNKAINYYASLAASFLLWIQPIASILTLRSVSTKQSMLVAYIGLSIIGQMLQDTKEYSMTRASNGHLSWNWMSEQNLLSVSSLVVYMIFLFTPILLNAHYDLAAIAAATLGLSIYSYWRENTWGSMWCWIVNGIVLLTVGKSIVGNSSFPK